MRMKGNSPPRFNGQRFCTLDYSSGGVIDAVAPIRKMILLVQENANKELNVLIHPQLHQIVQPRDLSYILDLLMDFFERIDTYASQLFHQLCSLSAGPLLTGIVGDEATLPRDIRRSVSLFVPLQVYCQQSLFEKSVAAFQSKEGSAHRQLSMQAW